MSVSRPPGWYQRSGLVIVKVLSIDPISFPHGYSFRPGVVTTVEPGYYKEGEYGIRTESLYVCKAIEVCEAVALATECKLIDSERARPAERSGMGLIASRR